MPDRELLEDYPLYRPKKVLLPAELFRLESPPIKMRCTICGDDQTYVATNSIYADKDDRHSQFVHVGPVFRLAYKCVSCDNDRRYFLIHVDQEESTAMKVGQWPSWDIKIEKPIERALGAHAKAFKHGLISESQGYGLGAFAYYRRIVEEVIDQLLRDIEELIPAEERPRYEAALERVAQTRIAEEKIDLVKDLLPGSLRPDGVNPLAALHSALSEGLHAETDEDCLRIAETVRTVLGFLVSQVESSKHSQREFKESMRRLLDRKAGKKA